jgi:NAD(P)-dependent dehydrogenase (short-subunit alcohol dehydrogenase family)
VQGTLREFGRIDILVNNAAVTGMPATTRFFEPQKCVKSVRFA